MKNKKYWPSSNDPVWLEEGYRINESVFCETFISTHKIVFCFCFFFTVVFWFIDLCNGLFFTEDGRVTDEMPLRSTIYAELKDYASNNVARKVVSILDLLKLSAQVDDFPPDTNCIHLANGTLNLNGSFREGKPEVIRNRLEIAKVELQTRDCYKYQVLNDDLDTAVHEINHIICDELAKRNAE